MAFLATYLCCCCVSFLALCSFVRGCLFPDDDSREAAALNNALARQAISRDQREARTARLDSLAATIPRVAFSQVACPFFLVGRARHLPLLLAAHFARARLRTRDTFEKIVAAPHAR